MQLPVVPPLPPMLARLARELPSGPGFLYEPKWDGFRCLSFRDGDEIDLRSRNQRPLVRYFPELAEALTALPVRRFVLDGEIVVAGQQGLDFEALLARLHPASSRVARLRLETPATLIAFDLLALGDEDLRGTRFEERRARLEELLQDGRSPVALTPITGDHDLGARWLKEFTGRGIDGVVAKLRDLPYTPGRRAMVKVKPERTADCVVAGLRLMVDEPLVGSLLLGLYDNGDLRHVGVVASFTAAGRRALAEKLHAFVSPLQGHPWERGFGVARSPIGRLGGAAGRWTPELELDWVPLRPELVCEVAYDQWDGDRFRHPARFSRWRPDRDPRSCSHGQLDVVPPPDVSSIIARRSWT